MTVLLIRPDESLQLVEFRTRLDVYRVPVLRPAKLIHPFSIELPSNETLDYKDSGCIDATGLQVWTVGGERPRIGIGEQLGLLRPSPKAWARVYVSNVMLRDARDVTPEQLAQEAARSALTDRIGSTRLHFHGVHHQPEFDGHDARAYYVVAHGWLPYVVH